MCWGAKQPNLNSITEDLKYANLKYPKIAKQLRLQAIASNLVSININSFVICTHSKLKIYKARITRSPENLTSVVLHRTGHDSERVPQDVSAHVLNLFTLKPKRERAAIASGGTHPRLPKTRGTTQTSLNLGYIPDIRVHGTLRVELLDFLPICCLQRPFFLLLDGNIDDVSMLIVRHEYEVGSEGSGVLLMINYVHVIGHKSILDLKDDRVVPTDPQRLCGDTMSQHVRLRPGAK
jgi:hypothetical protein